MGAVAGVAESCIIIIIVIHSYIELRHDPELDRELQSGTLSALGCKMVFSISFVPGHKPDHCSLVRCSIRTSKARGVKGPGIRGVVNLMGTDSDATIAFCLVS